MADYSKYYEAREVVTRILEQDFIGPVTKDECLAEVRFSITSGQTVSAKGYCGGIGSGAESLVGK